MLEGFRFLGMEREPEYVAIALRRIAWWAAQSAPPPDLELPRVEGGPKFVQRGLFDL